MDANQLQSAAEAGLKAMRAAGFDQAQVTAGVLDLSELNANDNAASMLRSTETTRCTLLGIVDGRMASTELADLSADAVRQRALALFDDARAAPQDAANAVSSAQSAQVTRGPQQADTAALADAMRELLDWRAQHTPSVMLEEALAGHTQVRSCTLTSGASALHCALGWYDAGAFGMAREGARSSSFNFCGGNADSLAGEPLVQRFGLEDMLRALTRSVHTEAVGERFTGAVVLTPSAVGSLLGWFLGQLSDSVLIAGSSVYRESLGQRVASPLVTLRSRFDAPGVAPFSADAFALEPVTLLDRGTLTCFTPSLYGSRKTGLAHVPVGAEGWDIAAGDTPLDALIAGVSRGALVDRLSMGRPSANGDFSGVIKNSFAIRDGGIGPALSETMIAGNVAQMLRDVSAVSVQRIDAGAWVLPWLRVEGLHFS